MIPARAVRTTDDMRGKRSLKTGSEKPAPDAGLRARGSDLDPIHEHHTGPRRMNAASRGRTYDRTLTACHMMSEIQLAPPGASTYVSRAGTGCPNRRAQKQADGTIRHYHAMVGAGIVAPGRADLLPLPPEFIRPRDGAGKQDCEVVAAGRSVPPGATSCRAACRHPVSRHANMFTGPAWTARGRAGRMCPHPPECGELRVRGAEEIPPSGA